MKRHGLITFLILAAGALGLLSACRSTVEPQTEASGISMATMIEQGRMPVEVSRIYPLAPPSPIGQYQITIKNLSSAQMDIFNGVIVFFDSEGNVMPERTQTWGMAEAIGADSEKTVILKTSDDAAYEGVWVPKRIIYRMRTQSGGSFMMAWDNEDFAEQLKDYIGDEAAKFIEDD